MIIVDYVSLIQLNQSDLTLFLLGRDRLELCVEKE